MKRIIKARYFMSDFGDKVRTIIRELSWGKRCSRKHHLSILRANRKWVNFVVGKKLKSWNITPRNFLVKVHVNTVIH